MMRKKRIMGMKAQIHCENSCVTVIVGRKRKPKSLSTIGFSLGYVSVRGGSPTGVCYVFASTKCGIWAQTRRVLCMKGNDADRHKLENLNVF